MTPPVTPGTLREVLRFYRALGFESMPLRIKETASAPPERKARALAGLKGHMGTCTKCDLCRGRTNVVFGEGNPDAELMFVGEAPGKEEDRQGRPFVGDAGKLLDRLIDRMGFSREEVYIANILKCRPPGNRDPKEEEIEACLPVLKKQIEIVAPRVIISLGRISAQTLLGTKTPISKLRGKFAKLGTVLVMPTYHPAYLLRNPKAKMVVWEDAQQVLKKLGRKPR
jgi:uracil-DNA glycosylase family 4